MVKVCSFGMRGCLGIPSIDLFPDLFVVVVDKDVIVHYCLEFKEDGKFHSLNLRFRCAFYN